MNDFLVSLRKEQLKGAPTEVYFLVYEGCSDVEEFFGKLDESAQAYHVVTLYRRVFGQPLSRERYHQLEKVKNKDTELCEYKHLGSKSRFLAYEHRYRQVQHINGKEFVFEERRIVLLYGYSKKEDKLKPGDITRALDRKDFYLRKLRESTPPKANQKRR